MAACASDGPHQETSATEITTTAAVSTYYYYNKATFTCLPFMSKAPADTTTIDDGALNMFSSVELCASFCPASMNYINNIT